MFRTRAQGQTSVQNLVKFSQFQMGVAARMGISERSSSIGGRPQSRSGGFDDYGRSIGGLQPISFTRELAFGGPVETEREGRAAAAMRKHLKIFNLPCFGRMALVTVIFLLAFGVYVVKTYEQALDKRLQREYEMTHPVNDSGRNMMGVDGSEGNGTDGMARSTEIVRLRRSVILPVLLKSTREDKEE